MCSIKNKETTLARDTSKTLTFLFKKKRKENWCLEIVAFSGSWLMAGFFKMHSDSSWRGAENYRVHTFKILGVLWGKMQTWYPCFIWKKWKSQSSITVHGQKKKKIQVGFVQLYLSLFTLCRKKALCGSECSWDGTRETRICLENKNSTSEKQTQEALGACECICTHLYIIKECIHTCTEE